MSPVWLFAGAMAALLMGAGLSGMDAHAAPPRSAADYYVSPSGNDQWSGRLPAPNAARTDGPFATLPRARDVVRHRIAAGLTADLTTLVRGGRYFLPDGITFGPQDSGDARHRVTYAAYPGERPTLIGGVSLTGWKPYRDGILVAALPKQYKPSQLFEDGERLTLARAPKTGYLQLEKPVDGQLQRAFIYKEGDLHLSSDHGDAEARIYIWPGENWFSADKPIAKVDPATRTITLGNDEGYEMKAGNRYFAHNALSLLTAPGEAVLHLGEGRAYVRPRRATATPHIVASTAPTLLTVMAPEGKTVRNLHFEGLNFSISNGDAVQFSGAEDCSLTHCVIENGAQHGVALQGRAQGIRITGNEIRNHGYVGVMLEGMGVGSDPKPTPDVNRDNVVADNHIHHCGRRVGHGSGVQLSGSGHNQIVHNEIDHMPRYGTTIKGQRYQIMREANPAVTWENHYEYLHSRNNLFAYNHIHHTNEDSQDTGAMESWGPGRDNVYDHNLIHDTGNAQFNLQSGMYLDDASDLFTLTNNVIYGVRGVGGDQPIYAKGVGNVIKNNLLIVGPTNSSAIRSLFMADERADHHTYERNLIVFEPRVRDASEAIGRLGVGVSELHPVGKTLTWMVDVPAAGAYDVWLYYSADNGFGAMDNRSTMTLDAEAPVGLAHVPNTGGWDTKAWSRAARMTLPKGRHTLKWTNVKGGGLNWDATVFTEDAAWKPEGETLPPVAAGKHLVVVQAEAADEFFDAGGTRSFYQFDNWSDDRVSASDRNLFWNPAGTVGVRGAPGGESWAAWRAILGGKYDAHSVVADPLFVNAAKRDYRLKSGSPAEKIGFQPIDLSEVGPRKGQALRR